MKSISKAIALCLALLICLTFPIGVSAATTDDATIDFTRTGSITIYKYDLTNSEKDGVWDSSYVSTGVYDPNVNEILGESNRFGDKDNASDLGNGEISYGYAIKGVEFTYLQIADIAQYSEPAEDGSGSHVQMLYGIDKVKGADFLSALGLTGGAQRFLDADKSSKLDGTKYYYQSDVLINALAAALEDNATTVKNALETYVKNNDGIAMPLTDGYGKTQATVNLGLYLICETSLPENVVSSANPALIPVPMTSVNGNNATDGGTRWIYDITLYPKNLTGIPSLEKTLRENIADGGDHLGSANDITDGYAHTGTASSGDVIDFQIISTLPSITSLSTYLSSYSFIDTLAPGLSFNKGDLVLEFFTDADCTDSVARWTESDGKFSVSYSTTAKNETVMTIEMTKAGLSEINTSKAVYTGKHMVNSGYSDCTVRITYQATVNSDASIVCGDSGNPNKVVLLWQRSSGDYYDTLVDDVHLYTYGIDLTKRFSDGAGDFSKVQFTLRNNTDGYYAIAELNAAEGIYYITGHTPDESEGTRFVPVPGKDSTAKLLIKGLENDDWTATEVQTDNGYTLNKEGMNIIISIEETSKLCDIYASDVLGLVQNDPRYAQIVNNKVQLSNIPQKHLEHHLLTASTVIDDRDVTMLEDNGSDNALAPLIVVNTRGYDLPQTGDSGTWMFSVIGICMMAAALTVILVVSKKKPAA